MGITFNEKQIENLSGFFMDISKGMFLAIFAVKFLEPPTIFVLSGLLLGGIVSLYFSLLLLEKRKKKNATRRT